MRDVLNDGVAIEPMLSGQEAVLASQQYQLSNTLLAVRHALHQLHTGKKLSIDDLTELLKETVTMNEHRWSAAEQELAAKHYSPSQIEKIAQHKQAPEFLEEVSDVWEALVKDIEAAQGEPPDSSMAKELARRWLNYFTRAMRLSWLQQRSGIEKAMPIRPWRSLCRSPIMFRNLRMQRLRTFEHAMRRYSVM
ncbi:MAG: hypothetical protein AAF662_05705 [Pseudomonadota bacterium]